MAAPETSLIPKTRGLLDFSKPRIIHTGVEGEDGSKIDLTEYYNPILSLGLAGGNKFREMKTPLSASGAYAPPYYKRDGTEVMGGSLGPDDTLNKFYLKEKPKASPLRIGEIVLTGDHRENKDTAAHEFMHRGFESLRNGYSEEELEKLIGEEATWILKGEDNEHFLVQALIEKEYGNTENKYLERAGLTEDSIKKVRKAADKIYDLSKKKLEERGYYVEKPHGKPRKTALTAKAKESFLSRILKKFGFSEGGLNTKTNTPVDTGEKTISGRTIWNDPKTGEDYSERSTTFEIDGKYYTMPTVSKDGRQHSEDQIRDYVKKYGPVDYLTGEKLPEFRYMEDAIEYAKSRSNTRKKPKAGMSEGGVVPMENQMRMFEEGGIADDGMTRDPVSGNEVPPGSLAREVRDDVPAQLSDGEYVVPADVVRFFGVKFFEDLRMTAKQGLQQMEKDGRIGGEPMDSPASQSGDDPLSPDEQELLQEIMAMEQAPQQPQPSMAVGGVVNAAYGISVQEGGNVTEDIPISTRTRTTGTNTGTGTGTTTTGTTDTTATGKDGMVSVFYIHPDGRRVKVLLLNGKPVGKVPDDFTDFVTDTPENRIKINFQISDETPVGAGTAAGAGTKAPGDDKMEERNQPGGDLYKEPKPKTFEDIGINGADPKAGAMAVLGAGKSAIAEGADFVGFGMLGAGIQGITQAEVISIAHANALYAEDVLKNDALAAEIRAEIKTYVDDQSIFLADVITDIASAFVKPGQNRLNDYEELGGKTAQEESKLSAEDIVKKRAEEKAEKERIEKERIEKERIEKERKRVAAEVKAQNAKIAAERKATSDAMTATQLQTAAAYTPSKDESNRVSLGQGTAAENKASRDRAAANQAITQSVYKNNNIDTSTAAGVQDFKEKTIAAGGTWNTGGRNKGGLIARPKKKTKKK